MNDTLIKGSKALEKMNLDIDQPDLRILMDYLHIHPFTSGEMFHAHAHSDYEMHYIAKGKGIVGFHNPLGDFSPKDIISSREDVRGINYLLKDLDQKKLEAITPPRSLEPGDVFVNPPGHIHWQVSDTNDPIVEYSLRCSIEVYPNGDGPNGSLAVEYQTILDLLNQLEAGVNKDRYHLRAMFEDLFEEACLQMPGYASRIKNRIIDIIIAFARNQWDRKQIGYTIPKIDTKEHCLSMVKKYIHFNLRHTITVDELAQHVFMSKRNLSRVVKDLTGQSVHQLVTGIRIKKAMDLVRQTQDSLSVIAQETGFYSAYHLSRVIKKHTGRSPSEYRKPP